MQSHRAAKSRAFAMDPPELPPELGKNKAQFLAQTKQRTIFDMPGFKMLPKDASVEQRQQVHQPTRYALEVVGVLQPWPRRRSRPPRMTMLAPARLLSAAASHPGPVSSRRARMRKTRAHHQTRRRIRRFRHHHLTRRRSRLAPATGLLNYVVA